MKKIYELLKLNSPKKGDVGIEVECEGTNLNWDEGCQFWRIENDGSLRGLFPHERAEFILSSPVKASEVKAAIKELTNMQKDAKLNFSFRTSVHVHVNVQELQERDLLNMIYTYFLLEEPLLNFCGKERKGNRFCLRLQDAEGVLDAVIELAKRGIVEYKRNHLEDHIRYAALNMAALYKYGSIEFRSMRGTLDAGVLNNWVDALLAVRKFACEMKNPQEIFDLFSMLPAEEFLTRVLGDVAKVFIYPNLEKDMRKSFSLSLDALAAFSVSKIFSEKGIEEIPLKLSPLKGNMKINWDPVRANWGDMAAEALPIRRI